MCCDPPSKISVKMRHNPTSRSWLNVLRPNIITSLTIERLSAPPTLLQVYNLPRSKFRIPHSLFQSKDKTFWSKSTPSWKEIAPKRALLSTWYYHMTVFSPCDITVLRSYTWECTYAYLFLICSTATGNLEHVQNFL